MLNELKCRLQANTERHIADHYIGKHVRRLCDLYDRVVIHLVL